MKNKIAKISLGISTFLASAAIAAQSGIVSASIVGADIQTGTGYAQDAGNLLSFAIKAALVVGILLALAFLILGGIEYITSGGEKGKTESARNKITAAVVGLILIAASFAILTLVLRVLGINGGLNSALNQVPTINNGQGVDPTIITR